MEQVTMNVAVQEQAQAEQQVKAEALRELAAVELALVGGGWGTVVWR